MLPGTTIALQLTSPGHHLLHHDHHHHHPYVQVNALHVPNHRPLVFLCAPQERAVIQLRPALLTRLTVAVVAAAGKVLAAAVK